MNKVIFQQKEDKMEVFERVDYRQIEKLLELVHNKIMEIMEETRKIDTDYKVDLEFDELEVEFLMSESGLYVHCIFVSTYGVDVIFQNPWRNPDIKYAQLQAIQIEVEKIYVKYMYSVFGDEFKTEYLKNVAKIFEEE